MAPTVSWCCWRKVSVEVERVQSALLILLDLIGIEGQLLGVVASPRSLKRAVRVRRTIVASRFADRLSGHSLGRQFATQGDLPDRRPSGLVYSAEALQLRCRVELPARQKLTLQIGTVVAKAGCGGQGQLALLLASTLACRACGLRRSCPLI